MKWYHFVVFIYISIATNGIEHLSMCLLLIYMLSLEKCLFRSFKDYLSFYSWIVRVLYIFWTQTPYHMHYLQVFSPILWGCFSLPWCCPISVNNPFLVDICTWCEAEVQLHLIYMWISSYLVNIYWKGNSFSFELSCHLSQKLIINVRFYFLTLCYNAWIYMYILL